MFKKCINCDGKGRVPMMGIDVPCPVCKGDGKLNVPNGKKICPTCKGKGGDFGPSGTACKECRGAKFVDEK